MSQVEGSESWKGQMSAARDSVEPNRPEKRSPARRRPSSGSEDRLPMLLREDAEEFGEFLHEGMSVAPPIVRSFEEDTLLAEKKAREVFEDSKLAEPQRLAAPPPTNAETSRTEVSAWVGSTSERRPAQEARWMP